MGTGELVMLAVVAVLTGVAIAIAERTRRRNRFKGLDLTPVDSRDVPEPAILEDLRRRVAAGLPFESFDPPEGTGDVRFAPGAADAVLSHGVGSPDDVRIVMAAIDAVGAGVITDWRVLERNLEAVRALTSVDAVLDRLDESKVSPDTCDVFWQLALGSSEPEAVKWGMTIGTLHPRNDQVPALELLGQHPELTRFAAIATMRSAEADPERAKALVTLLPDARQWAVVNLVNCMVQDSALMADPAVQRAVLVHSMANNDGIPMEVAFTVARHVDVQSFLREGERDDAVFTACCHLMETLLTEPDPLGGLADLPNGRELLAAFRGVLGKRPTDVRTLRALEAMAEFLDDEELDWPDREALLAELRAEFERSFTPALVRQGLRDEQARWIAVGMVGERKLVELLPDVVALHREKPEVGTLLALQAAGGQAELEVLLESIPKLVDVSSRERALEERAALGPEYDATIHYALIIGSLGRLGSPPAVAAIKAAFADFAPNVRASACFAAGEIPPAAVDTELRDLVEARTDDPARSVVEAAHATLAKWAEAEEDEDGAA